MIAMNDIQEFAQRIAEEFRPERIILFGSHAYGMPRKDSDVDLMVIMPFEGSPLLKSIEMLNRVRPRFAVDLLARTPEDFRWRVEQHDWMMVDIKEKGKVLYEAPDPGVG